MPLHELDLVENAFDSLDEAIAKFESGRKGEAKAFKFAVLNLIHFVELLFKAYVADLDPELIFVGKDRKAGDRKTIGLLDAVGHLNARGKSVSEALEKDLRWVKDLRNRIEHYKFSMDTEAVEDAFGRIIEAVVKYDDAHHGYDLRANIGRDWADEFERLAENYHYRLKIALKEADTRQRAALSVRPKDRMLVHWQRLECPSCGNNTLIPSEDSATGYRCMFCGETESDDIDTECAVCGEEWPRGMMARVDTEGGEESWCPVCNRHPDYIKDD